MNKISFILLSLFLTACSHTLKPEWVTIEQNYLVRWASDDSEVAVVRVSYEEQAALLFGDSAKRNFKHRIFLQKVDGSERRPLTQWRDYQPGEVFYMKPSGYLVVESLSENGTRRFDKVDLEGHWLPIVEEQQPYQPCPKEAPTAAQVDHQIIPSPNGEQLIEVYSSQCGQSTIEFLYANNLSFIDSQNFNIDKPMKVMWHPNGTVIMVSKDLDKAWQFAAQTPPLPIKPPRCFSPVTNSSNISSEGQLVYFAGDKLATKPVGSQKAFGGCVGDF